MNTNMEIAAWLILRIVYAWMFLYPLFALVKDWPTTLAIVRLIAPRGTQFFAVLMVVVMVLGAISILVGFYARFAGFALAIYCIIGMVVHYRLTKQIAAIKLSNQAQQTDIEKLEQAAAIGIAGHITSAQKNVVLIAVAIFFLLMGSGPWSLVPW